MNIDEKGGIRIVRWNPSTPSETVDRFLKRPAIDPVADETARTMLADIRERGDAAVIDYAERFDHCSLTPEALRVSSAEMSAARDRVDREFKTNAREAYQRIVRFSRAGRRKDWQISSPKGGSLGEKYVPYERVGTYIPAGEAPLASTALMTVSLAKTAGVPEIVACTPTGADGLVNPYLLFSLELAGATEIYKLGGIQAIGAMAYGTETIKSVQKIVGPGNAYVTAAKRLVYGDVALDMVAGPSEIAILADARANPAYVAADLLSQAEHGTGAEKVLLVTSSMSLAQDVREEMLQQTETLSRADAVKKVFELGTLIVTVENLDAGMELCNRFAPEHFEIMVNEPRRWVEKVKAAGAVFVGPWTPESAGDFAAGPSHVLPTGGTARMFSGLTVDDFLRRTSVISLTQADLKEILPVIEAFGRVEGLDAHARAAGIRFSEG